MFERIVRPFRYMNRRVVGFSPKAQNPTVRLQYRLREVKDDELLSMYRCYETIDQDWDRFYREYPHRYDRFAVSSIHAVHELHAMIDFTGTQVLDVGSGTGKSTFEIAKYADSVVGVEPWVEMRAFAINQQERLGIRNVTFVDGTGENLSAFEEDVFEHTVSVYGVPILWEDATRRQDDCDAFIRSCHRVVKPRGYIIVVATTPDWKPDHLQRAKNRRYSLDDLLGPHGFAHRDVAVVLDYGSVDEALRTYGFIYGRKAIDYLLDNQTSRLNWSLRIYSKRLSGS